MNTFPYDYNTSVIEKKNEKNNENKWIKGNKKNMQ